ncbi:DUF2007 domain-containing protein [Arenicella xantha]|uniref:Putative signal transducing protein n=1 Tax=Arenicella xantha TaxID=644221 RepID=A0A395JM98_9GAMM|nr:DUF2007 domain-containing protein [Arenicella xantha]RBP52740.1 putative signal transducing protein [Arenicella xantha]
MQCVYEASSGIEAHMIKNLLGQDGISAEVLGEHLQGGIGDLQAIGMVRVIVSENDLPEAQALINEWESMQLPVDPNEQETLRKPSGRLSFFIFGFVLGMLAMLMLVGASRL